MQPEKPIQPGRTPERISVEVAVRLALLGLFTYFAWTLMRPFLPIVLWSVVLTVAFYPLFEWLRDRLGGRSRLAAFLITGLGVLVTAGPATLLLTSLARSIETLARHLGKAPILLPPLPHEIAELPVVGPHIAEIWELATSNLEAVVARYGHVLVGPGEWALHAAAGLAGSAAVIFAAVIVSGFLYAPAPRLLEGARAFARHVLGERGEGFIALTGSTVRAVARGVVGVAMIQALLIGLGLIAVQVPAAGLLTLTAFLLCAIQIGALPIVVPILVWAWMARDAGQALILTAWLIPATLSDNVLKPVLFAKGLTTPLVVIFVGVIGGTIGYGLSGLFLGPVVLAVFYDLVRFWMAPDLAPSARVPETSSR